MAAESGQTDILARKVSFFVENYTVADIARLEGCRTSEGKPLCFSMLATLATVGPADRGRDLIITIELGRHTSGSLAEAVRTMPKEGVSQGGPHRRPPTNRMDGLAQIRKASRDWLDRDARVWRSGPWQEAAVPEADTAAVGRATDEVCALLARLAETALVLRGTLAVPAKKAKPGPAPGVAQQPRPKRSS